MAPPEDPPPIRRVLACHDGGPASRYVVPWARAVARAAQSEITLAQVLTLPDPQLDPMGVTAGLWSTTDVLARERSEAERSLEKLAITLQRGGLRARASVAIGGAVAEILRLAAQEDADLVILGSHKRGPFGRFLLGSVADAVKDRVGASVLIASSPAPPRLVLLATDDSPESRRASTEGERLARAWRARIVNVNVRPPGSAARGIVTEARGRGAGLIVLGSRGLGALASIALGSVSARVARNAPCSVLIVKAVPS